jgi:hypothetical protein
VPCLSSSVNALAVITDENTLLHMSISMIPHHLFVSLRSPFFGTGIHWLCATLLVNLPFKELANVAVDYSTWGVLHCFEGFGWNPVKTRRLPLFQLVNGFFDFAECNGIINRGHAWFLF